MKKFFCSCKPKDTSSHTGEMGDHTPAAALPLSGVDAGEKLHNLLQGIPGAAEAPNGDNEKNADADAQLLLRVRLIVHKELAGLKKIVSDHLLEMERGIHNYVAGNENQQLEKRVTELQTQLAQSLSVQRNLQDEVEMLKPQQSVANSGSFEEGTPTPPLLQEALYAMQTALFTCTVKMANQVRPYLPNSKRSQLQSIFHSQLCYCLFYNFESSSFGGCQIHPHSQLKFQRPDKDLKRRLYKEFMDYRPESEAKLLAVQQTLFREFYISRFDILVLRLSETSPFANQQQRQSVLSKLLQHEKCPLFVDFARLAKTVWLLHKLAFAFEPTAQIFHVNKGTHFDSEYMEIRDGEDATNAAAEVAFMTSPGFTVRNFVLKAQVSA